MQAIELDVSCSSVSLSVEGKYELVVSLAEPVDVDAVAAKFNKGIASLVVTMPCLC
jgi:HSP20 family molecular chaperone IbpA